MLSDPDGIGLCWWGPPRPWQSHKAVFLPGPSPIRERILFNKPMRKSSGVSQNDMVVLPRIKMQFVLDHIFPARENYFQSQPVRESRFIVNASARTVCPRGSYRLPEIEIGEFSAMISSSILSHVWIPRFIFSGFIPGLNDGRLDAKFISLIHVLGSNHIATNACEESILVS